MTCPLQAQFQYVERLPQPQNAKATFGSVVHKALETYNRNGDVNHAIEVFKMYWKEPDLLGLQPDYWPKYTSYGSLKEKGVEIIKDFADRNRWESRKILATEYGFLVSFGEFELTGYIDFLELKKMGNGKRVLRIVDLKTTSRQPSKPELRLDIQFTAYDFATRQPEFWVGNGPDFPGLPNGTQLHADLLRAPRRSIWYHLMTMKELDAGDRDDDDFMRLYRLCKSIEQAEHHDVFVPKIGEHCLFCPYTDPCGMDIPSRADLEAEVFI